MSPPGKFSKSYLRQWAKEQIAVAVPRQVVSLCLLGTQSFHLTLEQMQAVSDVERELSAVMLERNLTGIELEKAGQLDEAVTLYEQNVTDWFTGNHPYDRLRIIYTKRGQYSDAVRVCRSFVHVDDELIRSGFRCSHPNPKRDRFAEWAEKLASKIAPGQDKETHP
jgi:hypothetical protein